MEDAADKIIKLSMELSDFGRYCACCFLFAKLPSHYRQPLITHFQKVLRNEEVILPVRTPCEIKESEL